MHPCIVSKSLQERLSINSYKHQHGRLNVHHQQLETTEALATNDMTVKKFITKNVGIDKMLENNVRTSVLEEEGEYTYRLQKEDG